MISQSEIKPFPAVNAVIFNAKREVLLTQRSKVIREPGKWCLPGGHLDGGEDWITALRRECAEEIGIEVVSETLIGIYSDPSLTVTESPTEHGYRAQFLVATFIVHDFRGEIRPNHEVETWGYFPLNELPSPILKSHPVRISDAFQFNGKVFVR